jgi:hypothetical protein
LEIAGRVDEVDFIDMLLRRVVAIDTYRENMSINPWTFDMSFRSDRPYNDLPPLPRRPTSRQRPCCAACITARAALAELEVAGHAGDA